VRSKRDYGSNGDASETEWDLIGVVGPSHLYKWKLRCEEGMEACLEGKEERHGNGSTSDIIASAIG